MSLSNYGVSPLPARRFHRQSESVAFQQHQRRHHAAISLPDVTFYGGFEVIQFHNPAIPIAGLYHPGGYTALPGAVKTTDYDIAKILRVSWLGVRVAVRDDLD